MELVLIIVALFILAIASYTDIRTMEVPDWLNFTGIAAGLGIHLIFSTQQWNYWPILSSVIGLALAFGIACLMFYTGQWGGGDAKLLMAMGAIIGFQPDKLSSGTSFLINLVFIGGAWGLIWTTMLALKNRKTFWKTFKTIIYQQPYKKMRILSMITAAILITTSFVMKTMQLELITLALISYTLCYLSIFIKATEQSSMHKWITPDKLTEGDWLLRAVKHGKQKIMPEKLGLTKTQVKQIQKLYSQKKIKKVLVKYGIPFAPAFLFAFIATIIWNNIIFTILF